MKARKDTITISIQLKNASQENIKLGKTHFLSMNLNIHAKKTLHIQNIKKIVAIINDERHTL